SRSVLCVFNLASSVQSVSLDLGEFAGHSLSDLFSGNQLHQIEESPYILTMAPHSFYWLSLSH
ncbi:MAG TPA: alpha-glucosidase C-terminal domain-containing protein, partial [Candidatus Melainabacteria bacterium]|nr:alpha-glucosidase C-terminal domain-containing protein [Candidatus Melainabacteria bacterium]